MIIKKDSVHTIHPSFTNTLKIILLHYDLWKKKYLWCNSNILDYFKKTLKLIYRMCT